MARTTTDICTTLRPSTVQAIDAAAARRGWARSQFIDMALSGAECLDVLQSIADAGLAAYNAAHTREQGENPGEIVAAASTAGHDALRALNKIAAGNRK